MSDRPSLRYAHLADNHIDRTSRWEECLRLHDWIAGDLESRALRGQGPHLITFGGDLYEREPGEEEQNAAVRILTRFAQIAPVVIIRGNHDPRGWLEVFAKLDTPHPILVEEACGAHAVAGFSVGCVSWPRKAELLARLKPASAAEGAALAREALRDVFLGLGVDMAEIEGPRILLVHAMVTGALTSAGQPLVAKEMEVGLEDLALADADLVALGHVHKHQRWQHGDMHIVYPGSTKRTAYGEVESKGYVMTRFDYYEGPRPWVVGEIMQVVVPATPMLLVTGAWEDGTMVLGDLGGEVSGAEIRLRYAVASDRLAAAKTAAAEIERGWYEAGAVNVTLEDEVIPVTRVRDEAKAVAAAKTVPEQLDVLWGAKGIVLDEERRARLKDKLALILPASGVQRQTEARGAFRLRTLKAHGFRGVDPVSFDLDAIPGPLVAFTGANGTGKTMALGMLFAAAYREVPTRGTLGRLARDRDAELEVGFTTAAGVPYTVRHMLDGADASGRVLLTDDRTGEAVLDDDLVSKFDRWVGEHLPAAKVTLAGMFAAQGASGLLGMEEAERQAVILRIMGCDAIEGTAVKARDKGRDAREKAKIAAARETDERKRAVPLADARLRLAGAEEADLRAAAGVVTTGDHLENLRLAGAAFREESRLLAEATEKRAKAIEGVDAARAKLTDLEKRIANNQAVLSEAGPLTAAVAELATIATREAALAVDIAKAQAALEAARLDVGHAEGEARRAKAALGGLDEREARLALKLKEKPEAEAAAAQLEGVREKVAQARTAAEAAEAERDRLHGVAVVGADGRIGKLRDGLDAIMWHKVESAVAEAERTLNADDALVAQARAVPAAATAATAAARATTKARATLEAERDSLERRASRLPDLTALEGERAGLALEREAARAAWVLTQRAEGLAQAAYGEAVVTAGGLQAELAPLASRRGRLEPVAKRAEHLVTARAKIEAYQPGLAAAQADLRSREDELEAIAKPAVRAFDPAALTAAEGWAKQAAEESRAASLKLEDAKREVAVAIVSEKQVDELSAARLASEDDAADWTLLADGLGLDGIQAMLLDAAGPELTTIVNDLLHHCHGPRFSMRIDSLKKVDNGKREVEGCVVTVMDTRDGSERPGQTFSGGEKAFLSEALSLAVTVRQCRGLTGHTLVRDETGSTLDAEAARAYVAMLRRAAEITGASRVLFVSHSPEVIALADGHVRFGVPGAASKTSGAGESDSAPQAGSRYVRRGEGVHA